MAGIHKSINLRNKDYKKIGTLFYFVGTGEVVESATGKVLGKIATLDTSKIDTVEKIRQELKKAK